MQIRVSYVFVVVIIMGCCSCSGLRTASVEDPLFVGPTVKLNGGLPKKRAKEIKSGIVTGLRPKANSTFLHFFRPRLAIYHMARKAKPEGKGIMHWLKYHVGEEPVTISKVPLDRNAELVREYLKDNGFFNGKVKQEVKKNGRTAKILYELDPGVQFTIGRLDFPKSDSLLKRQLLINSPATLIRAGAPYNLKLLKQERLRLDSALKNAGFFYFQPDYLVFKADTSKPGHIVDLSLDLKKDIPFDAEKKMVIDKIIVNTDFTFQGDTSMLTMDTLESEGIKVLEKHLSINPSVISKAIAFKPGREYRQIDHDRTLSRLTSLGLYKYVNISFTESDTSARNSKLDCHVRLTPLNKRTLRLELQGVTKSNNFAGPVVALSYRDRNLFKNAEYFQWNLNTSFQTQVRKEQKPLSSYELSTNALVLIPKIVAPFAKVKESRQYTPRTKIDVGTGLFNRVEFYSMVSVYGTYGYMWRESAYKTHELNPVALNFLNLTNRTEKFQELLQKNLLIKKSFEEQFIIGSNYTFLLAKLTQKDPYNYYYMANIDLSGNTMSLLERAIGKDPLSFAGLSYSQYSRVENDGRFYYDITKSIKFATRMIVGIGVPYGNSESLPYIKQFFSGGANSIRAFAPRTVGPGGFFPADPELGYFEQGGELKLENSFELRFAVTKIIKPAIFLDAGNVWLLKEKADLPNGEFRPSEFTRQIAVGAGAGLRIDVSILIIRFDLAFPIQSPYKVPEESQEPAIRNLSDVLNRNYVLNVALGYPF
jgi:outer membrane protein insertion porin family